MQAEHSVINISGDNGVATHWSISHIYYLPFTNPAVCYSREEIFQSRFFFFWVEAFNKTLVIGLMTHPTELTFQNIN